MPVHVGVVGSADSDPITDEIAERIGREVPVG
jgi:hypothetical protein